VSFSRRIRPHVDHELHAAALAERGGRADAAFAHLERAHVLGQASTVHHVRAHLHMLGWAWRQTRCRELFGQLLRIVGAATKTVLWVPQGNTGGANVSAFRPMPIPPDLARTLDAARGGAQKL
jgi:hypothetical protein